MAKNMEKLIKFEHPKEIPEMKLDTIESFPQISELDLENIEPYTEPGLVCHIDLGLDQLEEPEE
jgi:hypothetical protein